MPQSKGSIDHHVMKPEDRIVGRVIQVGHVPATASGTVDDIVNRFQAVRILELSAKVVGFGAELAVVTVECKEVV